MRSFHTSHIFFFLMIYFPQHYEISLKFYHFICYALHPPLRSIEPFWHTELWIFLTEE